MERGFSKQGLLARQDGEGDDQLPPAESAEDSSAAASASAASGGAAKKQEPEDDYAANRAGEGWVRGTTAFLR